MGYRLGRAPKLHLTTDVVPPRETQFTVLTRLSHLKCHSVTDLKRRDAGSDSSDDAGRLMTQSQGLAHDDITIAVMIEVVEV